MQHFMVTKNATEAAKRVGYSPRSAYSQGHRLMKDDEVQEMLAKETKQSKERNLNDHDAIIQQLKDEALGKVNGHTSGSRVKALEILMKFYGMLEESQSIEVSMKENWFDTLDFIKEENHLS